jgi:hypothetical protein
VEVKSKIGPHKTEELCKAAVEEKNKLWRTEQRYWCCASTYQEAFEPEGEENKGWFLAEASKAIPYACVYSSDHSLAILCGRSLSGIDGYPEVKKIGRNWVSEEGFTETLAKDNSYQLEPQDEQWKKFGDRQMWTRNNVNKIKHELGR